MKYILRMIYIPMKAFIRTKQKVVYLSRQSNRKSLDMILLSEEIYNIYPDCQQVFRLRMIEKGMISKVKYAIGIIGDMYHMAGARVVICDTYSIPVSCLKHKQSLTIVQMWHAAGAIKKFGLQSLGMEEGRNEKISRALQMHENYDYVIAASESTARFYSEAFGIGLEKIIIATLPHIDYILDGKAKKRELYEKNTRFQGKELVLYLPTFRLNEEKMVEKLVQVFEKDNKRELLVSLHPLSHVENKDKYKIEGDFSTYDLMKIADYIITDYSACAFEASLLKVPLFFYVPDYANYIKNRGLNIDLKQEMKSYVYEDADELYNKIKHGEYDYTDLDIFREKYITNTEKCTEKLAKIICGAL